MENITHIKQVLATARHSINALNLYLNQLPPIGLPCLYSFREQIIYLIGYIDCMSEYQTISHHTAV